VVVSGWLGAASIKWLARIEVSEQHLAVPWNTEDYEGYAKPELLLVRDSLSRKLATRRMK
jgi:DMSO/TMAO reductase YedYZ molybdopterin-dependent catalytic subunit